MTPTDHSRPEAPTMDSSDLRKIGLWRAMGRLGLALLVPLSIYGPTESTPSSSGRTATPDLSVMPVPALFANEAASAEPQGPSTTISQGLGSLMGQTPATGTGAAPPGGSLDAFIPRQVGRYTLQKTERLGNDPQNGITDSLSLNYAAPDGIGVTYIMTGGSTREAIHSYRVAVTKDIVQKGSTLDAIERGRDFLKNRLDVVHFTRADGGSGVFWSSGFLAYGVAATNRAAADEFMGAVSSRPLGIRARWDLRVFRAYQESVKQGKPMLLYFMFDGCRFCVRIDDEVLAERAINQYAANAVYVQIDINADDEHKNHSKLVSKLGLSEYPVVMLADAYPDAILERGRVQGYFPEAEYMPRLHAVFQKPRVPPRPITSQ